MPMRNGFEKIDDEEIDDEEIEDGMASEEGPGIGVPKNAAPPIGPDL